MNYLSTMTENEIKYVCSVIPLQESVWYFKQYPKKFAKVMPGFRPTSLRNQEQVSAVLFRSRNQPFITSFLEKHINRWLEEIQMEIALLIDKGESKESAWLQILPLCFFVDDIRLYFRLTGEDQSEGYISLLSESVRRIKDLDGEKKKLKESLSGKDQERLRLKEEIKHIQADLKKCDSKLHERSREIKALKRESVDFEKLTGIVLIKEQDIKGLEKKVQERDELIRQLKSKLSATVCDQQKSEIKIREELEKLKTARLAEQAVTAKPRGPKDKDEFKDCLGYNLENLGIETNAEYYSLLKDYLCEILFEGKPILVSRNTGFALMKCVSNALVSTTNVATLTFSPDISLEMIDEFLSTGNRVQCLDNFIGNFDETILTTTCERHKDKILFLTVAYDKTLRYVPEELLKYCHYLNINRIEVFSQERDLTEDPSLVEETESLGTPINPNVIWASLLKDIFHEVGICMGLTAYKCSLVSDEERLIRLLAFDILPYCEDVLDLAPFAVSERLNKYAGDNGRCSYRGLFRRWFS